MFRFTIRDVLWLMLVAAVALGWFADRGKLVRQQEKELERAKAQFAGAVSGDIERLQQYATELTKRLESTAPPNRP